jgi:hypothetical protein
MELLSIKIVVIEIRGVKVTNSTWASQSKRFKVKIATSISQILLNTRMSTIHR